MLGGSFNFDAAVRDIVRFKLDLRATARTANDKDNMIGEILDMRPDVPAYKEDGTINEISYYVKNPLLSLMDTDEAKGRNFSGTLGLEWDIVKGLTFRTSATAQYNVNDTALIPLPGMTKRKARPVSVKMKAILTCETIL